MLTDQKSKSRESFTKLSKNNKNQQERSGAIASEDCVRESLKGEFDLDLSRFDTGECVQVRKTYKREVVRHSGNLHTLNNDPVIKQIASVNK